MKRILALYRERGLLGTSAWVILRLQGRLIGTWIKAAAHGNAFSARILGLLTPVRQPEAGMTYVLIFLGEFGYELLNWQGVARSFAATLPADTKLMIAGRAGLQAFYGFAHHYVDISGCDAFRDSVAAAYFAMPPTRTQRGSPQTVEEREFDAALRVSLESYVRARVPQEWRRLEFVFSSRVTVFPGCVFGADWRYYGIGGYPGQIYSDMDFLTRNNRYERTMPLAAVRRKVEEKLTFSLGQPFVLVQTRSRTIGPNSGPCVDATDVVRRLASLARVVVLSFDTGRRNDSRSQFQGGDHQVVPFSASSFDEQSWLIAAAQRCVFITEGDLGSHTYLPPLMGRDVHVVASQSVFSMPSAPIDLWNQSIFRFGGQMRRLPWERLCEDHDGRWLQEALALPEGKAPL